MGHSDPSDLDERGTVETAVREDIAELDLIGPVARSLAASAYNLARKLDGDAGMATAAVARELRETLRMIAEAAGDDDDGDLSQLGTPPELPPALGDGPPAG